ncbi:Histone deacetylase 15 [Auxenochlorella protothecoides]|uniref:histone deacetylase n=1 Tax=Auxenochlorella protothecoides TaxID=3075 RepID=A0A087SA14_AUXPR|nr:Histone deacetylase 15 [Auxenochlorella protothecoides]KFM22568.1 Histone deacetylase 15 [Auxenochlorella protothecoides]
MDATEPHSPVLKGEAGLRPAGFTSPSPSVYAMHASSSSEEGAVHSGDLGPSGAGPGLDAAYERYAFYPGAAMFDDEDEEDEGAEDYDAPRHCVNCTAPLWDDVCLVVTVVAYDDAMLLHQESEACPSSGGGAHPERPERLRAVWARLQAAELAERCVRLPSRPATDAELEAVHSRRLVRGLEALSEGIRRAEEREEEGEETAGFADAHQLGAEIFAADPSVLYASLHRHEGGRFYPGTGAATDVGVGPGAGASLNVAWPRGGLTDADYAMAFATVILPVAREFDPDLVIISAGFDAAQGDPIGGCHLTPGLFASLTAALQATVAPCVAVLEGGYNLRATAACTEACARGAAGVWRDEGGEAGDNLTEGPSSQGDADALSTPAAPACLGARPPSPDASLLHEEDDVIAADEALDPHAGEPRDAQQVEPRDAQEVKLVDVSAPRGAKPPRDVPAAARLFAASPNRAWSAAGLPSPPGHPIPSHRPPGAVHPAKRKFSECGPA